jgi:DNA-directed RNA polymerase specialized sigma24 family protein
LHIERELPAAEIAALLGVGPSTVAKWLRRAGIARDRLAARRLMQRRRSAS